MSEIARTPKYSLRAGWICLICALASLIIAGPLGFIVAGPLIVICMILAVIGMAKNNTGGGIALLLSSLLLPPILIVLWLVIVAVSAASNSEAPLHIAEPIIESTVPGELSQ